MTTSTGSRLVRLLPRDGYEVLSTGAVRGSAALQPTNPVLGGGSLLPPRCDQSGGEPGAANTCSRRGKVQTHRRAVQATPTCTMNFADYPSFHMTTDALHAVPASNTTASVGSPCDPPTTLPGDPTCQLPINRPAARCRVRKDHCRLCRVVAVRRLVTP